MKIHKIETEIPVTVYEIKNEGILAVLKPTALIFEEAE